MAVTNKVLGYAATGLAVLTSMLSFTMLLSRFNGSVDREYPILLSEYFEVNPARQRAIIDVDQNALVTESAGTFESIWDLLTPLNVALQLPKATLEAAAGAPDTTDPSQLALKGLAGLILQTKADLGGIKPGYNIYNKGFQNLLIQLAGPAFAFDDENPASVQQYNALEATLGFFDAYTTVDGAKKAAIPGAAARAVVTEALETADERFTTIRVQTRTAVASSCVAIVSFIIVLTILLVDKKTYALPVLNGTGALAGLIFLIMIQLNLDEQNKLLEASAAEAVEGNPGPAVFGAGFALGAGLIGAVVSFLWVRMSEKSDDNEDEDDISMDEVKSEEAVKAEI